MWIRHSYQILLVNGSINNDFGDSFCFDQVACHCSILGWRSSGISLTPKLRILYFMCIRSFGNKSFPAGRTQDRAKIMGLQIPVSSWARALQVHITWLLKDSWCETVGLSSNDSFRLPVVCCTQYLGNMLYALAMARNKSKGGDVSRIANLRCSLTSGFLVTPQMVPSGPGMLSLRLLPSTPGELSVLGRWLLDDVWLIRFWGPSQ